MDLEGLFEAHVGQLQTHIESLLDRYGHDGLVIYSGHAASRFFDDQQLPFFANPHFKHWVPLPRHQQGMLWLRRGEKPVLFLHHPHDIWHLPEECGEAFWQPCFNVMPVSELQQTRQALTVTSDTAFIGEDTALASAWGFGAVNPKGLLNELCWQRSFKSAYELQCLRDASKSAVAGHQAAVQAFKRGGSEFDVHMAYLAASGQRETALPYGNIVAFNEHAATLHYQHLDRIRPPDAKTLLIDAGAEQRGYCADITRTYAAQGGLFAELVSALDQVQQRLVSAAGAGVSFVALHEQAHRAIGLILQGLKLVHADPSTQVEAGITRAFFPHGLGHLLGIQVHDVTGLQADARGTPKPAPASDPFLRLTRTLEPGMVFTIEPGIYFIPALLEPLRTGPAAGLVDWSAVESLIPFGGVRIEDNVVIHADRVENLTRDAFDLAG